MTKSDYLDGWQAEGEHRAAPSQIATQRRLQQAHVVCSGRILDLNVTLDCVDMSFIEICLFVYHSTYKQQKHKLK